MDVTSLLNANSVAAEQQKTLGMGEISKTPTRNRTPWDAGGYSLPINTISNLTPSTPPQHQNIHHDDSQAGASASTPTSPRHKFSDSRSSLSSFTSSLQSTNHSRLSSMSTTTSGTHPLNSLAETLSPSFLKLQEMDLGHPMELTRQSSTCPQRRESVSTTGSLDALAIVAENRIADQQTTSSPLGDKMSKTPEQAPNPNTAPTTDRPSSPSDAILIKRATLPSLRVVTGDRELNGTDQAHPNNNFLSAPLESHHQSLIHSKSHKRALSAPDFAVMASRSTVPSMADSMAMRPRGEPTPPASHHPDNESPTIASAYPNPDTPPADNESHAVVCMYIPNCDTGSQPRKAISHIFGRNKMCTRLIPQHVWVHYCRKHYQRSRYRNPKEYAKLQCDLVQQQIRRVHEWSQENAKKGGAGVVSDWGIAVRKREQKRLDDLGGSRKRNAAAFEHDSDEGEDGEDGNGRAIPIPATAVPDWLLALCGKGYNTQAILEIFNRLHTEILEDTLPCFPDVEILPNIVVDQEEPKSPKGYTKRTQGHKRAQSLGVGMKSTYLPQDRRQSQPALWNQDGASYGAPIQKRRRPNDMTEAAPPGRVPSSFQASRFVERPLEPGRHMQPVVHRSNFANIDEHQAGEDEYHGYPQPQYQAPLAAPTPQRHNGQSMAAHLEMSNEHGHARRPIHQRSQSDVGGLVRRYEHSPAANYAQKPAYYQREPQYVDAARLHAYGYDSQQPHYEQMQHYSDVRQSKQLPVLGHHRAQSSSMIQSTYSPAMPSLREHEPQANVSPYTHNQNVLPPAPHVTESSEARALYSSRR
ncbi:hypothetical protein EG329_009888 [Mollisiaceae sp. DMI_Dod_QoI]|nr:hypothetical protein EG329_009888 [Helotiales sp. DMI_Dod_QoI]